MAKAESMPSIANANISSIRVIPSMVNTLTVITDGDGLSFFKNIVEDKA